MLKILGTWVNYLLDLMQSAVQKMRNNKKPTAIKSAPFIEKFNTWLSTNRDIYDNRRDLAALQLAHEQGAITDEEVRRRASVLVERDRNERMIASTKTVSDDIDLADNDAVFWYSVSYGKSAAVGPGKLIASRRGRIATLFSCPRRAEEKVTKYCLAFESKRCTDEFVFDLLANAKDPSSVKDLKGSKGFCALSVSQNPTDRSRADALLRKVIPKQVKVVSGAASKIQRAYRKNFKKQHLQNGNVNGVINGMYERLNGTHGDDYLLYINGSELVKKGRTKSPARRRSKNMKLKQETSRRRTLAALKIQRVFRTVLTRRRAAITIQKHVRIWLKRRKAIRVLQRFVRFALRTSRRRRALAFSIIESREALHAKVTADVIEFFNVTHATMMQFYPLYNLIINQVRESAMQISPIATVEPYGSSVTGLALPSSDLDLVVCFQNPHSILGVGNMSIAPVSGASTSFSTFSSMTGSYNGSAEVDWYSNAEESAHYFCKRLAMETDWVRSVKVVGSSTQPVIKLVCHPRGVHAFSIQVDITFWHPKHTGIQNSFLVREILRCHPQVGPLVLVIKQYLRENRLNSVYSGGLSSIALVLMVWIHARDNADPLASLGELLVGFFAFYGEEGFFSRFGLSPKDGVFCLSHVEERQEDFQPPAVIEDPLREGNNLAVGTFRVGEVNTCFRQAMKILAESNDSHPLNDLLRCHPVSMDSFSTQPVYPRYEE